MNETAKETAAQKAAEYIQNHTVIGVGTGSTVRPFILALNERVESEGLILKAAATSLDSRDALSDRIKIIDEALPDQIDICIDGADRASKDFDLIKGGGGALLREKLVALNAKKNITIIDESKIATPLQGFPLPVEIIPFGYKSTLRRLSEAGFSGSLRTKSSQIYMTDGQNYIYDIELKEPLLKPERTHQSLLTITGVIETGLFLQTSDIIIIGKNDGSVDVWNRG